MTEVAALSPYLAILIGAALPTQVWRWLGVLLAGRIDEGSEVFTLVRAIATALLSALIAKLILFPTGPLATVPLEARLLATAVGFATYLASGKRLALGIAAAEAALAAAWGLTR